MGILLWILGIFFGIIFGIPLALIVSILALYLVFVMVHAIAVLVVGVATIPISLASRIAGKSKLERDDINDEARD